MPLRVVHINTADTIGGAGIAAYRLHRALNRCHDVESKQLVGIKATDDPDVSSMCRNRFEYSISRFTHRLQEFLGASGVFSPLQSLSHHPLIRSADIVHLHHVMGGFFPYKELMELSERVQLVWTLHDMWGFTGFCHNSMQCRKWEIGCGNCPHLPKQTLFDLSHWHWNRKRDAYQSARLTVITPSNWLMELACNSPLMNHLQVRCIPNAVDTNTFKPVENKSDLRLMWGIKPGSHVLMIASQSLNDKRKGASILLAALCNLPKAVRESMTLFLIGSGDILGIELSFGKEQIISAGYIKSPEKMAECYAISDLFLHPTVADNLPNTLVESIACGTPAVTFDVGGCGDVIRHMETGYLAKAGDFGDFVAGIELLLSDSVLYEKLKSACRKYAVERFSDSKVAEQYLEIYKLLVTKKIQNSNVSAN